MQKFIFSILLFLYLLTNTNAQAPGYLGRKNYISITSALSPASKPVSTSSTKGGLNFSYGVSYERTLSRRWVAGLSYRKFKSGMTAGFDREIEKKNLNKKEIVYQYNSNLIEFTVGKFGLQNGIYENDLIAPVGRYFSFSVIYNSYNVVDKEGLIFKSGTRFYTGYNFGGGASLGNKFILKNLFLMDYSININYFHFRSEDDIYTNNYLGRGIAENATDRVQGAWGAFLKISAGYLF